MGARAGALCRWTAAATGLGVRFPVSRAWLEAFRGCLAEPCPGWYNADMLLGSYDTEITTMACDSHAQCLAVFAHLHQDVSEALPYLNAVLPGAVYDHAAQVLTWKSGSREISLRPRLLAISDVADRDDAARQAAEFASLINDTWERRADITPNYRKRLRAPALTMYRMLPGGNCKACGEETCWIFATKLSAGVADLDACTALLADTYAGRRIALRDLLAGAH